MYANERKGLSYATAACGPHSACLPGIEVRPPTHASASTRLHAAFLYDHGGGWRCQEFCQCLRRIRLRCTRMDTARKYGDLLNIRRKRPKKIDAAKVNKLADLLESDLHFPLGNHFAH